MDEKSEEFRAALKCISHRLMERSLTLLDKSGASTSAIHLDHAIATLGLRARAATGVRKASGLQNGAVIAPEEALTAPEQHQRKSGRRT
jgi:hypothetical protein